MSDLRHINSTVDGAANAAADIDAGSSTGTRARSSSARVSDKELLDAARKCVLTVGVRRTTLAEVARTAQVSRMTLYRRFPDVRSMVAALMTREFGGLLREASSGRERADSAREWLANSAVSAVRALASDQLMQTVLYVDGELVLPYIVQRMGRTQQFAEGVISNMIAAGHADGSVRIASDAAAQARSVLLVIQSFVFSLRPATKDVPEESVLNELRHLLNATLRPDEESG